jgi:hypothetical protein
MLFLFLKDAVDYLFKVEVNLGRYIARGNTSNKGKKYLEHLEEYSTVY